MQYLEEKQDLFTMPKDYMLVHCVSADYMLGAGIAKRFAHDFNMRYHLRARGDKDNWEGKGRCVIVNLTSELNPTEPTTADIRVANLVTKGKFWNKPTYKTLMAALDDLHRQLIEEYPMVKKIAMPKIGCGLDGLSWREVSVIIALKFRDWDGTCVVCLPDKERI